MSKPKPVIKRTLQVEVALYMQKSLPLIVGDLEFSNKSIKMSFRKQISQALTVGNFSYPSSRSQMFYVNKFVRCQCQGDLNIQISGTKILEPLSISKQDFQNTFQRKYAVIAKVV